MTTTSTATGTVNTAGSTTYITGAASGLDTASLISAAVAQKTAAADTLDAKVTANKTKIAAYQQLQSLVTGLATSMKQLAAPTYSTLDAASSVFQNKAVSLTSSDSTAAASYISASADADAAAATYKIQVSQLAAAEKVASSAMDPASALGLSGGFTLQQAGGQAATIAVTADMTLNDVAGAINAAAPTSGVSASIVKDSGGGYRLVLSANDTNREITASAASGDDVLAGLGLTGADGAFADVLQAAQPAILTLDGAQITSDGNNVTDAVSGLSFSLLNTTPAGTTLTLAVTADYSAVKTAITDFIDAYNSLRAFVSTNQQVGSDGSVSSDAVLFADSLLRSASQTVGALLSTPSASATGSYATLADLGITMDASNQLELSDENALDNALLSNLADVAAMFQTRFAASASGLKLLQNSSQTSFDFTLDVTLAADGAIASASVNGDSSLFTVSGSRLVGAAGGIYDGLSFALVTDADASIHVSLTQGLANQLTSFASLFGDASGGLIQQQIDALTAQDAAWSDRADQIRSDANDYQTSLINRYAAMEQEVSAAQLMQSQIKALLEASSSS